MKEILNRVYRKSSDSFFDIIDNNLTRNKKMNIISVNPEIMMISSDDLEVKSILLKKHYYLVPDGIAVIKAMKKLNLDVCERITGIEISNHLLEIANKMKKSIYLYGAEEKVVTSLVHKINSSYKNIKVLGYKNGYIDNNKDVVDDILKLKPDICLVALGMPKQEKFIDKYYDLFKKGIFVGVGGTFDVLSGYKKRAPKIFINLHLEWLYRILKEPKRIKRFLKYNVRFIFKKIK